MTEQELEEFGRAYVRQLRQKVRCYELAADICDGDMAFVDSVKDHHQEVEAMPPLAVAVLVLSDWGASIPAELVARANCVPVTVPSVLEIH